MPVKELMVNLAAKIKFLLFYLLARLVKIAYLFYALSIECRTTTVNPQYHPRKLSAGSSAVYVFWHAKLFMIMPTCRNSRVGVLTLRDWKNFFYDKLCRAFGYITIPLTSDFSAVRKLRKLLDDHSSIGLAADGPRGPAGVIRPGAVYLAQKTKRPVITIDIKFKRSFRLRKRWDALEIPLPFSQAILTFGEPIYVDGKGITEISAELKSKLGSC